MCPSFSLFVSLHVYLPQSLLRVQENVTVLLQCSTNSVFVSLHVPSCFNVFETLISQPPCASYMSVSKICCVYLYQSLYGQHI